MSASEEKPTGRMRWRKVMGDLYGPIALQQEWQVTFTSGASQTEWRDVPVVYVEEPPHDR